MFFRITFKNWKLKALKNSFQLHSTFKYDATGLTMGCVDEGDIRIHSILLPQSNIDAQVKHPRSLTAIYGHRDRMRSYCAVLHGSVLRAYFSVSDTVKYDHLRILGNGCLSSSLMTALHFLAQQSFTTLGDILLRSFATVNDCIPSYMKRWNTIVILSHVIRHSTVTDTSR